MSCKLNEEQVSFINKRIDSLTKVTKQINELQAIINEKSVLRQELSVIINEYVVTLGLDPKDAIFDLKNAQILSKKEQEEKKQESLTSFSKNSTAS